MLFRHACTRSALVALALAQLAGAADWPQWRGPKGDNIAAETGLLKAWPKEGPALAWKATGIGDGFSSVSVAQGKVFTLGDIGDAAYVMALDLKDGALLWKTRLGAPGGGGGYPGPRATPTVDGAVVYALGQQGDLLAVQVADGAEVWRKNLNRDFAGQMMSGWGNSESPVVAGDLLLCTPGGKQGTVLALDKKTGAVRWRSQELTDPAGYSPLLVVEMSGVKQVLVYTGAHLAGLALDSGKLLWSAPRPGRTAVVPTPVVKGNSIFVTSGYGVGCNRFTVTGSGAAFTVAQDYENKQLANHHGGIILLDDHVFGHSDSGGWTCMDFKTGNVAWHDGAKLPKGTLAYADGHFYLRGEGGPGTLVLLEASTTGWQETGRFNPPDRSGKNSWAHLVISNGRLFVRDQGVLLCYDIQQK